MKIDPPSLLKSALFVVAVAPFMIGCSGYQYVASPRYIPTNEAKGQLTLNLHPSAIQTGYAFANSFSVFATGYSRFPSISRGAPSFGLAAHRRYSDSREVNAGFSYFRKSGKFVLEVVAGGGYGDMSFGDKFYDGKHGDVLYGFDMSANRRNFFIQPNLRFKFGNNRLNDHFSLVAFAKFNSVRYYNIESDLQTDNYNYSRQFFDDGIEYFAARSESSLFFIETGAQIKGGSRKFKVVVQLCPVFNVSGQELRYQQFSISSGFTMSLDVLGGG